MKIQRYNLALVMVPSQLKSHTSFQPGFILGVKKEGSIENLLEQNWERYDG